MNENHTNTTPTVSPSEPKPKQHPAYGRPIAEIVADLEKDIPDRLLATKTLKGHDITFIPWYRAKRILDYYAPGWEYEIRERTITQSHVMLTVRIYINAAEGRLYREATGLEALDMKGYGDPSSNAESMAFRRAAAKWGLGIGLYEKED